MSLSSFSEFPIFPKKILLLGTKKLSTLYLETTHLFGLKLWLQEVPITQEAVLLVFAVLPAKKFFFQGPNQRKAMVP